MGKYKIQEITDRAAWEEFVLAQKPQSFLHSWNWGETQKLVGNKTYRLGVFDGNKLTGVCLAILEQARRGSHIVVPGGPLIDWGKPGITETVKEALVELAREQKAWFVRVRPELIDRVENRELLNSLGFAPAPMHLHAENTWVLNIDRSEEEVLSGMRKTTRYLVRKSLNSDLVVEQSTNPDDTRILYKLQSETAARHKFVPFDEKIFKAQLETFGKDNQATLFLCKKGREVLAAAIIIFYGDYAYYHHSASTISSKEIPFSYFLQWQVILEAKKRGCKAYNFWGIAPTDDPKHRFAGVSLFKKGFGGERIDWLHAHDLPITPFYWVTYSFETIRKIVRKL